jgi:hypothetical protein
MGGAGVLLTAIRARETALMEALFSAAPDPFARSKPGQP